MTLSRRSFSGAFAGTAVCGFPSVARAQASRTLRLGMPDATTHPNFKIMNTFAALVQEKTKGSVKVNVFPNGQLGNVTSVIAAMQTGTLDLAISVPALFESLVPELGAVSLPFLFKDEAAAERVLDGPIGKSLMDKLPAKGFYGLCWSTYGWRVTESKNKVIKEPKDFQGLKIRLAAGPIFVESFKAMGAIPTVMDPAEIYIAMSQGAVDALEVPILSYISFKLYEVAKHVSLTNHSYNPAWLVASKRTLDTLSEPQRQAIRTAATEIQGDWRKSIKQQETEARKFLEGQGVDFTVPDLAAFESVVQPVYEKYRATFGTDLVDAILKQAKS